MRDDRGPTIPGDRRNRWSCTGEGCELTLASDLVYASARTQFGRIEVHGGVVPGFGGTWRLSRRVGDCNQRLYPDHGQQGTNHLRSRVLISGLGCLLSALQILLSTIVVSAMVKVPTLESLKHPWSGSW